MRNHELTLGRSFAVAVDHGVDFFAAPDEFSRDRDNEGRQGFIPDFSQFQIVGTFDNLHDPNSPVWTKAHLANVEGFGDGALAYEQASARVAPHIHVAVGLNEHSVTSHLLDAIVQVLTDMLVTEVADPPMRRVRQPDLDDVLLLRLAPNAEQQR